MAVALLCFGGLLPLGATAATSGGGTTIANAPTLVPGQRVFGNLASDPVAQGFLCLSRQVWWWHHWWLLNLRPADQVEVSWETPGAPREYDLCVFSAGTTDATVAGSRIIGFRTFNSTPQSGGASFVSPARGVYPLLISAGLGDGGLYGRGPYSLLVQVRHKALVFIPRLSRVRLTGRLIATVRDPDGDPITDSMLTLRLVGIWKNKPHLPPSRHVVASAKPSNGEAVFRFALPRAVAGTVISLRVVGGAENWQSVASATRRVRVVR